MSLERKVGQLMSVALHGSRVTSALEAMIRDKGVGGVILYSENFSDAASLSRLIAELSEIARQAKTIPLFFEIDQEGGAVTRIGKGATVLPGQMALAATPDPAQSVRTAVGIIANELNAVGVNWNLAPDGDVNDEPTNPVIGNRSFSSDPARVSSRPPPVSERSRPAPISCSSASTRAPSSKDIGGSRTRCVPARSRSRGSRHPRAGSSTSNGVAASTWDGARRPRPT